MKIVQSSEYADTLNNSPEFIPIISGGDGGRDGAMNRGKTTYYFDADFDYLETGCFEGKHHSYY